MAKYSGILLHISSLPEKYGIGTFGREAYRFVDFLVDSGQKYWQVLPLLATSYGDSPYQSPSAFAGNPYFIDLETLAGEGLLKKGEAEAYSWGGNPRAVDYGKLFASRYRVLTSAYETFLKRGQAEFCAYSKQESGWLDDYALYMAFKRKFQLTGWPDWPAAARNREPAFLEAFRRENEWELNFWRFTQFEFSKQWRALKRYANGRGVELIGDMPIYLAYDSVEVWAHPEMFDLGADKLPREVAGVPPDAFTSGGQLWGNPLYRWDVLERQGFDWWIRRLQYAMRLYDVVRIDHFRGFESYYAVPYKDRDARSGVWRKGPGAALFRALNERAPGVRILAEDLGYLDDAVRQMLKESGYPGMKVLQFAFDGNPENDYLPRNYPKNCVVYTGTHDNPTAADWYDTLPDEARTEADRYFQKYAPCSPADALIALAENSRAEIAVIPMQDFLHLGREARMNTPSTVTGNWQWRLLPGETDGAAAKRIFEMTAKSHRQR